MAFERGFRRIVIVLSGLLLAVGIGFDVMTLVPHTTVRVTLIDGRQETLEVQWVGDYPRDRKSLARELSERPGFAVQANDIKDVTLLRGPEYWWWTDGVGMKIAAAVIGCLWVGFYLASWIARGFARH